MTCKLLFWAVCVLLAVAVSGSDGERRQNILNEDAAFEAFLWVAMRNYSSWLSSRDPLLLVDTNIKLKSDKQVDFGVDADFEITYLYSSGHSKVYRSLFTPLSQLEFNAFSITRGAETLGHFAFGGDYLANGTIEGEAGRSICFRGRGTWTLRANETFEYPNFLNIEVNDDGYIDLRRSSQENSRYLYMVNWTEIEFEGLELLCENKNEQSSNATIKTNADEEQINRIKTALAQVYKRFMNSYREFPIASIPPKLLLYGYLTDILLETKLSDIISNWSSTTAITSSTITDSTSSTVMTTTKPPTITSTTPSTATILRSRLLVFSVLLMKTFIIEYCKN